MCALLAMLGQGMLENCRPESRPEFCRRCTASQPYRVAIKTCRAYFGSVRAGGRAALPLKHAALTFLNFFPGPRLSIFWAHGTFRAHGIFAGHTAVLAVKSARRGQRRSRSERGGEGAGATCATVMRAQPAVKSLMSMKSTVTSREIRVCSTCRPSESGP